MDELGSGYSHRGWHLQIPVEKNAFGASEMVIVGQGFLRKHMECTGMRKGRKAGVDCLCSLVSAGKWVDAEIKNLGVFLCSCCSCHFRTLRTEVQTSITQCGQCIRTLKMQKPWQPSVLAFNQLLVQPVLQFQNGFYAFPGRGWDSAVSLQVGKKALSLESVGFVGVLLV